MTKAVETRADFSAETPKAFTNRQRTPPSLNAICSALIQAAQNLRAAVSQLTFVPPVTHIYNPLDYAWPAHEAYLRQYGKSHGVEIADALIAASAVANRATLWTRNRKHYPMKELSFFD